MIPLETDNGVLAGVYLIALEAETDVLTGVELIALFFLTEPGVDILPYTGPKRTGRKLQIYLN